MPTHTIRSMSGIHGHAIIVSFFPAGQKNDHKTSFDYQSTESTWNPAI